MQVWLGNVLNAIMELQDAPSTLMSGIVIPDYQGSEKDPVKTNSYRHAVFCNSKNAGSVRGLD